MKCAFLQGYPTQRDLFVRPPKEAGSLGCDRQGFWKYSVKFLVTVAEFVSSLWSKAHRELQQFCRMNSNLVGIQSEHRERLEDEGTALK